jgi:hypothetical protein
MLLLFLFFFFRWCYSPSWSLASSTDVFQWSRFFYYRLQVLTSIIFRSAYAESILTVVGLPTRIGPSGLEHVGFLEEYWSCSLQRYSRQLKFLSLIFTVHVSLHIFLKLISEPWSLYFILLNWYKDLSQCSSFSFLSTLSSLLMSAPHPLSQLSTALWNFI